MFKFIRKVNLFDGEVQVKKYESEMYYLNVTKGFDDEYFFFFLPKDINLPTFVVPIDKYKKEITYKFTSCFVSENQLDLYLENLQKVRKEIEYFQEHKLELSDFSDAEGKNCV